MVDCCLLFACDFSSFWSRTCVNWYRSWGESLEHSSVFGDQIILELWRCLCHLYMVWMNLHGGCKVLDSYMFDLASFRRGRKMVTWGCGENCYELSEVRSRFQSKSEMSFFSLSLSLSLSRFFCFGFPPSIFLGVGEGGSIWRTPILVNLYCIELCGCAQLSDNSTFGYLCIR